MLWANLSLDILPSNITNCKAYTLDDFDMIFVVWHFAIILFDKFLCNIWHSNTYVCLDKYLIYKGFATAEIKRWIVFISFSVAQL